jgi:hypothetical protein
MPNGVNRQQHVLNGILGIAGFLESPRRHRSQRFSLP